MRVRAMTATGDMTFGQSGSNFFVNSPQAVAQLITTRLKLWVGEWFLDQTAGTPWSTQILGTGTKQLYDSVIRTVILNTPGVIGISEYSSSLTNRSLAVTAQVVTQYSTSVLAQINQAMPFPSSS
jgi:hypothetical protein